MECILDSLTPMMRQYHEIKQRFKEEILFFRMGDFYEMFGQDAEKASKILEIALTKRSNILMCGIPYHAKDNYIHKVIKAGYKVAICDQLEDPSASKGIVKRGVTEVITPGTLVDDHLLNQFADKTNNYIMSLNIQIDNEKPRNSNTTKCGGYLQIAYIDISTGDFYLYKENENDLYQAITDRLYQTSPAELVLPESIKENEIFIKLLERNHQGITKTYLPDYRFDTIDGSSIIHNLLKVKTLKGFGVEDDSSILATAGALVYYLRETQLRDISHLTKLSLIHKNLYMQMNESTIKNLELIFNLQDNTKKLSLFSVLNETKTSMGTRLLHQWILNPLLDIKKIHERQKIVRFFYENNPVLLETRMILDQIMDIERLIGKIALNKVNPRDLILLKNSLIKLDELKDFLSKYEKLSDKINSVKSFQEIINHLSKAILEEPSIDFTSGSVIQMAFNHELDDLRNIHQRGKEYLIEIQEKEREVLGIANLKIKYNKVVGYFIEVSKGNTKHVPDHYIKKQTLTNATRYTLPELTEYESKILGAQEKIIALERELFEGVRLFLCDYLDDLKEASQIIAELDILSGFAYIAINRQYILPEVTTDKEIIISEARHPVVEYYLKKGEYIPNDIYLDNKESRLLLITGPNMAGKSTYLRQAALLVIMAQLGSYIPCQYAKISLTDKIFTRIGASDNLARGESTFLVEMIETALILNNATERSLVIMDEIGRGTSTYDGLSIAWSIVEYMTSKEKNMGKILFATHYHELTALGKEIGIQNYQVMVREWGDEIIFLHKVNKGTGNKSYGIQVARLAGLPEEVIQRAKVILADLENRNHDVEEDLLNHKILKPVFKQEESQFSLFEMNYDKLAEEILKLELDLHPNLLQKKLKKIQERIRKGELSN